MAGRIASSEKEVMVADAAALLDGKGCCLPCCAFRERHIPWTGYAQATLPVLRWRLNNFLLSLA